MAEISYEFAVFGSTPLAELVAGLLASAHGKRVCIVGEPQSPFRLARGIDLSVMAATRPETWALLNKTTPETLKLLSSIGGRSGYRHVDPILIAETEAGIDALSHVGHIASGFGERVERLSAETGIPGSVSYRWSGALLLDRPRLRPVLEKWLREMGVLQLAAGDVAVTLRRDGSARLEYGATSIEIGHAVLADDAAILSLLEDTERDRTLLVQNITTVLTEPSRSPPSRAMIYVDRLVKLIRGRSGSIAALAAGRANEAAARIGACLASHRHLQRAGQASFRAVATVDGAPLVGKAKGVRVTVLAGLGDSGAFLAPAIARLIAKASEESEKVYFAAREGGRGTARAMVADYQSPLALEAQF